MKLGWIVIFLAIMGMTFVAFYTPNYISYPVGIFVILLAAKVGFELNDRDRE